MHELVKAKKTADFVAFKSNHVTSCSLLEHPYLEALNRSKAQALTYLFVSDATLVRSFLQQNEVGCHPAKLYAICNHLVKHEAAKRLFFSYHPALCYR
jgi:hypothetical protein